MSQASNYNARCRPAEVFVEGRRFRLIRRRERPQDLLRGQVLSVAIASLNFNFELVSGSLGPQDSARLSFWIRL